MEGGSPERFSTWRVLHLPPEEYEVGQLQQITIVADCIKQGSVEPIETRPRQESNLRSHKEQVYGQDSRFDHAATRARYLLQRVYLISLESGYTFAESLFPECVVCTAKITDILLC